MNRKTPSSPTILLIAAISLLALAIPARAVPYASDLTNSAGVVSFRLNENADNVKIISSGGTITNDIGPGLKGVTVTNLGVAAGTIKVMVSRSVAVGYTQSSVDLFQEAGIYINKFEQARSIVVNKNPATPSFGRIYICNTREDDVTVGASRHTYEGIYMLNSDDTVALDTGTLPRTAGLPFDYVNAVSPFKMTIGKDDGLLYITDDSDPAGGLWVCDLDVATNSIATNVFQQIGDLNFGATNHGSIYSAVVEGSLAGSNLRVFTMDEDLGPIRSAWRYDINAGPLPYTGSTNSSFLHTPGFINTAIKLVKGGVSNYLYVSQNRSAGTDGPSISIFTENGVFITNSLAYTRSNFNASAPDIFRNTTAIDISPDGQTLALLRGSAFGSLLLVPITNGVLNVAGTNSFSLGASAASDNNRDIAYDAAGNLYMVNTASEFFRIFSKGGASVAITGTDGTFVMGTPPTIVSVSASVATGNETGPANGTFTLTRTGDTSVPLTVNYTVAGTAASGSDYSALAGSVTFAATASSTNITVAVSEDPTPELTETVILNITGSGSYGIGTGSATVSILDNEPTEVSVALAQAESRLLEGYSHSKLGFLVTRKGLIGPALTVNLAYSGATAGADFSGPASVAVAASAATGSFNLTSLDDESYEGNETVNVSVASGAGYALGTPVSASGTIIDDEYPAGAIYFSDNFETDSSANWITNAVDSFADSAVDFAFDYSTLYVPAMPGASTTKGLRFRLNETSGSVNAVSASPFGLNLSGDYRLRFKAWINYNGPMFDGGAGSTMHLTAGIGHTPDHANLGTSAASDGIWTIASGDGGSTLAVGDATAYAAFTLFNDDSGVYAAGTGAPDSGIRKTTHSYYALWGGLTAPASQLANYPGQTGTSGTGNLGISWHTVVLTKSNNIVYWTIDGINIATLPTDSVTLGNNVFVGFEDVFPGVSGTPAMSFIVVDNLRVERFISAPIIITDIKVVGANLEITFSGPPEAVAATDFELHSSATVGGTYANEAGASWTGLGSGMFRATIAYNPVTDPRKFFKVVY